MNDQEWLIKDMVLIGINSEELCEVEVFLGKPYISKQKKINSEWSCDFKVDGRVISFESTNVAFSSFSSLLGAIANIRHLFRMKVELEDLKLFSFMHDINKIEPISIESLFIVDDCIPEDYEYVINVAKKKGISLD